MTLCLLLLDGRRYQCAIYICAVGVICASVVFVRRRRGSQTKLIEASRRQKLERVSAEIGSEISTVQFSLWSPRGHSIVHRTVFHGDALDWIKGQTEFSGCVITSMPDIPELSYQRMSVQEYSDWFVNVARDILAKAPSMSVTIFYQTDFRTHGQWVDKSALCSLAASHVGSVLLFHKIVCTAPPDTCEKNNPRPRYTHLLAYSRTLRDNMRESTVDVLADRGHMPWERAMGVKACKLSCDFILQQVPQAYHTVIDPFCGYGTILAVANSMGMDAIGVERNKPRCKTARNLVLDIDAMS